MNCGIPLAALLVLVAAVGLASPPAAPAGASAPRPPVTAISPAELDAALQGRTWVIVEFGGEHCIPCRAMQPILQDLQAALGGKAKVHNFWIQANPEVARRFKIMVMPTQVVFNQKGEEVLRHQGIFPADEFHAALAKAGLL
ncbi:MAG: thioredoxin family protein [Thermoanaerobaculales bacterium]